MLARYSIDLGSRRTDSRSSYTLFHAQARTWSRRQPCRECERLILQVLHMTGEYRRYFLVEEETKLRVAKQSASLQEDFRSEERRVGKECRRVWWTEE